VLQASGQGEVAAAMRVVPRRTTKFAQPRPPWDWRNTASHGAPRTLLSNHKSPITTLLGGSTVTCGQLDWMLRLYQHKGATKQSATYVEDGVTYVVYHQDEWGKIQAVATWLEFVKPDQEAVCRTDIRSARKSGHAVDTSRGPMWAVPLSTYTTDTQE
jgi:hypothetical protein